MKSPNNLMRALFKGPVFIGKTVKVSQFSSAKLRLAALFFEQFHGLENFKDSVNSIAYSVKASGLALDRNIDFASGPDMPTLQRLPFYLTGFALVFLQAFLLSVPILWALQIFAMLIGQTFDAAAMLEHLFLSLSFLAFFPGQTFWSYSRVGPDGRSYVIIGPDPIVERRGV